MAEEISALTQRVALGTKVLVKRCTRCNQVYRGSTEFALAEYFGFDPRLRSGWRSWCKRCAVNEARRRRHRDRSIDIDAMIASQNCKCGICGNLIKNRVGWANLDHDHRTGVIRKVLCQRCNIKMHIVDDEEWLAKAIAYRNFHRTNGGPRLSEE